MRFYRGISVPRQEAGDVVAKIRSHGLQPGDGWWTMKAADLKPQIEEIWRKPTVTYTDTRPEAPEPSWVCACAEEEGGRCEELIMAPLSIFDKEPGTELPDQIGSIGRTSFDVVRPQLFFIRDQFFKSGTEGWRPSSFPDFVNFPIVAGYILGVVGGYLAFRKIRPSEVDVLKCVIDVDNHYYANDLNAEISLHYMMQQSTFKFGLEIGGVDVIRYLTEQALTGKIAVFTSRRRLPIISKIQRHPDAKTQSQNILQHTWCLIAR